MSDVFRMVATDIFGRQVELRPSFLRLRRSLDSPAEGMSGSFPLDGRVLELISVRVLRGGDVIFEGKIDEQRTVLSREGMVLQLEARTRGALLLDNEAMPQTLENPTTHGMFERLIARHGFLLIASQASLPEFTVRKGLTLWDAFSVFTRRTYGRLPFVMGDMVIVARSDSGSAAIIGGRDIPFSRLEHTISHHRPISRVFIRDDEGGYDTFVSNPEAPVRQIVRERFLIPAGEFVAIPRWDSTSRIRRSMRQMQTVLAELPGFWEIRPGRGVIVDHPQVFLGNLLVDQLEFTLDQRGARTVLTLASALYD